MTDPDAADPYAPPPEGDRGGGPPTRPPDHGSPWPARPSGPARPGPPSPPGPARPPGPRLRSGRRALGLAVAGAVLLVPLLPAGLVLVAAGLIQGIRALRAAGREGGSAPGAIAAVIVGAVGSALGLGLLAGAVFLLPELRDYRECMSGANTEIARSQCWTQFESAYQRKLGVLP